MYIKLNKYFSLKLKYQSDNLKDYIINYDNVEVGIIQVTENEDIFIRQIRIYDNYRRKGYANNVVDLILSCFKKNISFCIATTSESAIYFWNQYLKTKSKFENIKGHLYKIYYA